MHFLGTHLGLRPSPAGRCALFKDEDPFLNSEGLIDPGGMLQYEKRYCILAKETLTT
jgi:hypothetical protein